MATQNDRDRILDLVDRGVLSADQGNVRMVRLERFRIVHKLPSGVRKALNAAVKCGELGHMCKDGLKPEVYFHPTFRYLAIAERERIFRDGVTALSKVCG